MSEVSSAEGRNINKVLLIPLLGFLALVVVLAIGFKLEDPHLLPSVLINRPFPEFELKELYDEGRIVSKQDLFKEVSLVNVWATWCPNCIIEPPQLLEISRAGVPVYGINYNDDIEKARAWLLRYEDPYELILVDDEGTLGIDLGVYGAPETFVVDAKGEIQYKHVGIVTEEIWSRTLRPLIQQLRNGKEQ